MIIMAMICHDNIGDDVDDDDDDDDGGEDFDKDDDWQPLLESNPCMMCWKHYIQQQKRSPKRIDMRGRNNNNNNNNNNNKNKNNKHNSIG